MTRRLLLPLAAGVALAAGCGSSGGDPDADPAAIVPARAPVYLEADLSLEGDQQDAVNALSEKLAGTDQPGAELKRLIEREMREDDPDFSFKEDVDPWLGDRIGLFVTNVTVSGTEPDAEAAFVAPTEDADKARETLERELGERDEGDPAPKVVERTHRDVEYKVETNEDTAVAIVDEYAVMGTDRGVKAAIDAREGSSLASSDDYKEARGKVADDGVGIAYVGTSQLLAALGPQGAALRPVLGQAGRSIAVALDAEEDAIRVESAAVGVTSPAVEGDVAGVIGALPSTSWLAAGTADVGGQLEQSLRQFGQLGAFGGVDLEEILQQVQQQTGIDVREDLLSWMGDAGVFVQGSQISELSGALVVRSTDEAKSRAVVPKLGRALERLVPGVRVGRLAASVDGVDEGLTLRFADVPLPVHVAAAGDRFVIAVTDTGLEAALDPQTPLSENTAFRDASGKLGDGVRPSFFLDFAPVRELVDSTGAVQGADAERARRALDRLTAVVAGSKREEDVQRGRLVVGVK